MAKPAGRLHGRGEVDHALSFGQRRTHVVWRIIPTDAGVERDRLLLLEQSVDLLRENLTFGAADRMPWSSMTCEVVRRDEILVDQAPFRLSHPGEVQDRLRAKRTDTNGH